MDAGLRTAFDAARPDFPQGTPFWRDLSFQRAVADHSIFKRIASCLPTGTGSKIFNGQAEIADLWSSYKDHGYGSLFYGLVRVLRPVLSVELGVLQGFSLLSIAAALRENSNGAVQGFDLFEDYPYRHESYANVLDRIETLGLSGWATASRADAFQVHNWFDSTDLLHVDISNDGDTYRRIFEQWASKVKKAIVLEGGSPARDQVEWMVKYGKPPIAPALREIAVQHSEWEIFVIEPFPSLTVALRAC